MDIFKPTSFGITALAVVLAAFPDPAAAQGRGNAYGWADECRDYASRHGVRRDLEREHRDLHRDLDRIHAKWHKRHDGDRNDRRWRAEHDRLHRGLSAEHREWHNDTRYRLDRYDYRHDGNGRWRDGNRWNDDWDDDRDHGRNGRPQGPACRPVSNRGRVYRDEGPGSIWRGIVGGIRIEIPW